MKINEALEDWKAKQTAELKAARFQVEALDTEKGHFKVYAIDRNNKIVNALELRNFNVK